MGAARCFSAWDRSAHALIAFTFIVDQFSNLFSTDSRICAESYGRAQNALSHEKLSVHIAAPPKVMINRAVATLTA